MYADLKIQEWVFSADLTAPAKLVLFALIYHANKDTGKAFPSLKTIAEKTSLHKTTVSRALKLLEEKGMIEYLGSSGRSDNYRVNCISGISPPKGSCLGGNKRKDRLRSAASEVAESDLRGCTERSLRLQRAISEVAQSDPNQSNNQKQSTNPPTKKENRPPAIQPTVFKQCGVGVGEGECSVVDDERERMFEEFWAAYPDRCPRKVDRARCRQKYVAILADSADSSKLHATMLQSLKMWDESEMWNKKDGQYIRAPYAWLDKRSWEDSPAPAKEVAAKKAAETRTATENRAYDWTLCAERCANCGENRCEVGVKVPPDYGEWASPPEECRYFRAAS